MPTVLRTAARNYQRAWAARTLVNGTEKGADDGHIRQGQWEIRRCDADGRWIRGYARAEGRLGGTRSCGQRRSAERGRAAGGQATDRVRKGTAAAKPRRGRAMTARVRKGSPDTAQGRRARVITPLIGSQGHRGRRPARPHGERRCGRRCAADFSGRGHTGTCRRWTAARAAGGAVGAGRSVAGEATKRTTAVAGTGRSAGNKVVSTGTGIGTGAIGAVGSVVGSAVGSLMRAVVRAVVRAGLRAALRFVKDKALLLLQFIKRLALKALDVLETSSMAARTGRLPDAEVEPIHRGRHGPGTLAGSPGRDVAPAHGV